MEQYNKMAQEVKDLGAEIERLEQQAQIEAPAVCAYFQPVHADPKNGSQEECEADCYCRVRRELLEHDPQPWSLR